MTDYWIGPLSITKAYPRSDMDELTRAMIGWAVDSRKIPNTPTKTYLPEPKTVIFHPPATIVYWEDGEKTVVKCMEGDEFSPEVGLAMCLAKYIFGKRYKKWFRDALKKGGWEE